MNYTFRVAGTTYRIEALESILTENQEYRKKKSTLLEDYDDEDRVWRYLPHYSTDVKLVDEPDNPNDPNAIRVEVDGIHIGYIKKESTSQVRSLMKNPGAKLSLETTGGQYKEICEDEDGNKSLWYDKINLGAKLTISIPSSEVAPGLATDQAQASVAPRPATRRACATPAPNKLERNKWVAFFLCLFLGGLGAHRFYEAKVGTAILYIFTLGLFGIGWLVDLIIILTRPNPYYI